MTRLQTSSEDRDWAAFDAAVGTGFAADDPDLALLQARWGLDPSSERRLQRFGAFVASAITSAARDADHPGGLPGLVGRDPRGRPVPSPVRAHPSTRRVVAAALTFGAALDGPSALRMAMIYLLSQAGDAGVVRLVATTDVVRELLGTGLGALAGVHHHLCTQAPGGPVLAAVLRPEHAFAAGSSGVVVRPGEGGCALASPVRDGPELRKPCWQLTGHLLRAEGVWARYWVLRVDGDWYLVDRELGGASNGVRCAQLVQRLGARLTTAAQVVFTDARAWRLGPAVDIDPVLARGLSTSGVAMVSGLLRAAERLAGAWCAAGGDLGGVPQRLRAARRGALALADALQKGPMSAGPDIVGGGAQVAASLLGLLVASMGPDGIDEELTDAPRLLRDALALGVWLGPAGEGATAAWQALAGEAGALGSW